MTRTRRALVAAGFSYAQFALAMVSGFVLIPFLLHYLGVRTYGLWLATSEVLVYGAMLDLGVYTILPWLFAEADGRQDRDAMRRVASNGIALGLVFACIYAVVMTVSWQWVPAFLKLSAVDRATLAGPLAVLVGITAISYPIRLYTAVIVGLQDVKFYGAMSLIQAVIALALPFVLIPAGFSLYALALAAAVPPLVTGTASLFRVRYIAPDLRIIRESISFTGVKSMLSGGFGAWMSGIGWQLMAASNSMVIAHLGHPEWAPVFVATAKVPQLLSQLSWVLPDSALVGLAQLGGESRGERMRQVVTTMLRLHVVFAGAIACGILAFNGTFVRAWLGPALFGGVSLNTMLALGVVVSALVHGIVSVVAVLGNRPRIGAATVLNGVVHLGFALFAGARWQLPGVAAASMVSAALTTVPIGLLLLRPASGLRARDFARTIAAPWLARAVPLCFIGWVIGAKLNLGVITGALAAGVLTALYLFAVRGLYQDLPVGPRVAAWMMRLRVLDPPRSGTEPG